jgi:Na+-transporting methylmalonyl-CoA/oxaloacetate decarboxylase gamma subunit
MTLILIIFCIWGASALVRASKEAKRQRELEKQRKEAAQRSAELARMTAEWKQRQAEAKIETARIIAV